MSHSEFKCPLCGCEFDRPDAMCRACPMSRTCNVICCPNCGYGFVGESKVVTWLKRLARRVRRPSHQADRRAKRGGAS